MVLDVNRQIGYAGHELYKGKGCHIARYKSVGGALFSQAVEPVGGYRTESVTHGWCDSRPTVTFPVAKHFCPVLISRPLRVGG